MKKLLTTLSALALCVSLATAQMGPAACSLVTEKQLNSLLGTKLKVDASEGSPDRCSMKEEVSSGFHSVVVSYFNMGQADMGAGMIKMKGEVCEKQSKDKDGPYNTYHKFEAGGAYSYYATGNSSTFGKKVCLEFLVGSSVVTFETTGVDPAKVVAKLPEIYKIMKSNFH